MTGGQEPESYGGGKSTGGRRRGGGKQDTQGGAGAGRNGKNFATLAQLLFHCHAIKK